MADMRVARTRQYLRDALVDLLREKPFDEVTVREVVERAGVSKNSFYNHYADLASLAQDCFLQDSVYFRRPGGKRLRDYACRHDACTETLDEWGRMLHRFKEQPNLASVILNNILPSPYFSDARHAEEALLIDHLETEYGSPIHPYLSNEDLARYITWGMFGHLRSWFMDGMRQPVERTVKSVVYYALSSTASAAGRPIEGEYLQAIEDWHCEG